MTTHNIFKTLLFMFFAVFMLSACGGGGSNGSADVNTTNGKASASATEFIVYKNPQCGCCSLWVKHMENAGFRLQTKDVNDVSPVKREFDIGLPEQSCHTAVWDNGKTQYAFEGHVPAPVVQRFLEKTPANARGLLVPGMPLGSPGMEQGDMRMAYNVLLLKNGGATEVYARVDDAGNISFQ